MRKPKQKDCEAEGPELPDDVHTLGDAIRHLRGQKGLSLRSLANQIDVSAPFMSDVEHNRRSMKKETLARAAGVLGVTIDHLKKFENRLTPDIQQWAKANPGAAQLIRELKESGRSVDELRSMLRAPATNKPTPTEQGEG